VTGTIVIYLVIAAATYYFYTRKRPGREVLGALLWPVVLLAAVRDLLGGTKAVGTTKIHEHHDKGVPESGRNVEQVGGIIETRKYGQIDPNDD
jgi:hypothetical protein